MSVGKGALVGQGGTASVYEWGDGRVVKVFTPDYAYSADMEYGRTCAVHAAGVPCPEPLERTQVDGLEAIVFERVDGPTLLEARPPDLAQRLAELHAEVHARTSADLPTRAQLLAKSADRIPPEHREALREREAAVPSGDAICHALFHPGHVLLAKGGPHIIDWPDAFAGPAALDVARTAVFLRYMGVSDDDERRQKEVPVRERLSDAYLRHYLSHTSLAADAVERCRPQVAFTLLLALPAHPERAALKRIAGL